MHNYTVLNRFTTKTKLGNWYEQSQLKDYEFKQYLYKKNIGDNVSLNTQAKLSFSQQNSTLTSSQDGFVHFGDLIMLFNVHTQGVLASNIYESIAGQQTYAVTTSKNTQPVLRNTFQIQPVVQSSSGALKYGDKIRLVSYVNNKKIYLQSLAVSPMRSSKFSRNQQVSVTTNLNANSIWVFEHVNPKSRFDCIGQEIKVIDQVLIKHNSTCQWLASDKVNYVNQFGAQFQTFSKSFLSNNKTQNLFAEKVGHKSVENPLRSQGVQNLWRIVTGNK